MASQSHDSRTNTTHNKPWERPWSTDEIRQNAHKWTLAGDSGLLQHLHEFSQNVLNHTHSTGKALDSLVEDINNAATEINNVNNRFLCLANTQFVENRVYEDDDRDIQQDLTCVDEKSKEESDAAVLKRVKEALSMSVAVLDTMFEPVELQASDSDGEVENEVSRAKTLLLEPHNPYLNRPLPHLIGSDAFMFDDKIGLGDSPSDTEDRPFDVDEDVELSSESERDSMLLDNKRDRDDYSSISSASESGSHFQQTKKVKSSDFKFPSVSSNLPEADTHTTPGHDSNRKFAEQLAEKLGNMAANTVHPSTKSTTLGRSNSDLFGGSLLEEEEEDDSLFKDNSGLFSGRPKLFDDLDDTNRTFWGKGSANKCNDAEPDSKPTHSISKDEARSSAKDDLFGLNDDDEDDIFSFTQNKSHSLERDVLAVSNKTLKANMPPGRTLSSVGDFDPGTATSTPQNNNQVCDNYVSPKEQIDSLSSSNVSDHPDVNEWKSRSTSSSQRENIHSHEKKPPGGVLLFGQASLLAGLKDKLPRRPPSPSSSSASDNEQDEKSTTQSVSQSSGDGHLDSNLQSTVGVTSSSGIVDSQDYVSSSHITFPSPLMSSTRKTDDGYQSRSAFSSTNVADSATQDLFQDNSLFNPKPSSNISSGLFADVEDNEDDLFAGPSTSIKPPFSDSKQVSSSIFSGNDDFEDLFSDIKDTTTKSNNISTPPSTLKQNHGKENLEPKPSLVFTSNYSEDSVKSNDTPTASKKDSHPKNLIDSKTDISYAFSTSFKSEPRGKPLSLFEDSDSDEDDLLFSSASSAGSRRSQASADLLSTSGVTSIEKKPLSARSLFDNDDALFDHNKGDPDVDIFSSSSNIKRTSVPKSPLISKRSSLLNSDQSPSLKSFNEDALIGTKDMGHSLFSKADDHVNDFKNCENSTKPPQTELTKSDINVDEDSLLSGSAQIIAGEESKSSLKTQKPSFYPVQEQGEKNMESENCQFTAVIDVKKDNDASAGASKQASTNNSEEISKHSAGEKPKKPEPPKTLNIRKETDPSLLFFEDEDDDLFCSVSVEQSATDPSSKVDQLFPYDMDDKSSLPCKKPLLSAKPGAPKDAVSSEHQVKSGVIDVSEVDAAPSDTMKIKPSLHSSGGRSLQSSLKIDPLALLPGAKPPTKRCLNKGSSHEISSEGSSPPTTLVSSQGPQLSSNSEPCVGFDQPLSSSSTLHSANKDRAKLGSKRRPPSSKARREAARKSQSFESPTAITPVENESSVKEVRSSLNPNNNILSPSTDEDDLFGVPQDLPPEYGKQNIPSGDIFGGAPVLSPAVTSSEHKFASSLSNTAIADVALSKQGRAVSVLPTDHGDISPASLSKSFEDDESLSPSLNVVPTRVKNELTSDSPFPTPHQDSNIFLSDEAYSRASDDTNQGNVKSLSLPNSGVGRIVTPTTNLNVTSAAVDVDPLINSETLMPSDDEQLFTNRKTDIDDADHSSLFPFVKKKSDGKDVPPKPLFSRAPSLPSKSVESESKTDSKSCGIESDLFSPSGNIQIKSVEETSPMLKKGSAKIWQLSDDDDDDLFLSGAQSSRTNARRNSVTDSPLKVSQDLSPSHVSPLSSETSTEIKKRESDDNEIFLSGAQSSTKNFKSSSLSVAKDSVSKGTLAGLLKEPPRPNKSQPDLGNGLFGEMDGSEDHGDSLFFKPSVFSTKSSKIESKSSLFDEDDDDLFGSSTIVPSSITKGHHSTGPAASQHTGPSASNLTKLKTETTFEDPLMALNRDD